MTALPDRHPAGTSAGGKFARKLHGESDTVLVDERPAVAIAAATGDPRRIPPEGIDVQLADGRSVHVGTQRLAVTSLGMDPPSTDPAWSIEVDGKRVGEVIDFLGDASAGRRRWGPGIGETQISQFLVRRDGELAMHRKSAIFAVAVAELIDSEPQPNFDAELNRMLANGSKISRSTFKGRGAGPLAD